MKNLLLLFAGAFAALAMVACSDDEIEPEPEPTPEPGTEYDDVYYAEHASISCTDSRFTTTENGGEVHFKAEGGDVQVLVSCGTEWTVSSNTAAFTVEITDTYYVTITAAQNLADEDLTGTVTLATAEMNIAFASIAVTQDGLGHITLSAEELSFPRTGGEMSVTVESESDWDCEYESDWFTVVADTGAGTLTVTCELNTTGEVREGTVTVTAGDNSNNVAGATLTITQEDFEAAALVLEYTINEDGTEIQLPLGEKDNTNGNVFTVDCTVDWGDGSEVETVTGSFPSHTYSEAGTYTVIINGKVELLSSWDCDKRSSIAGKDCLTAVKQWGDLGLKSMDCAFYDCESLTTVPEDMFSVCIATENFNDAFCYCYNLAAVPSFKGLSNATSFEATFYDCYSLTTVPEDMFSGCTAAEDFWAVFYDCVSLTTVPEDMFSDCTAAENFKYAFSGCSSLTSAPSFKGLSNATDFWYAFWDCTSLTTVPEDMFSDCTAAENFEHAFSGCSSLTSAPSFKGLSNATDFWYAFWDCTSLTTLPEGMFSGCTAVERFGPVFGDCTSLTTVPANLFADCPSVGSFYGVFYECTSLESVPVGIFDNNKSVTDFSWAFTSCTKLNGESPYTEINVDGTPVKVHLYERENYSDHFTAPTTYSDCFTDCTGLDDYYSIPSGWGGGGSSPNSITPQSLNSTSPEEFSPSRLGPHRDATTPQGRAARPLSTRK